MIERIDSILTESKRSVAINLGTGSGTTVREPCAAFIEDWIPVRDELLEDRPPDGRLLRFVGRQVYAQR